MSHKKARQGKPVYDPEGNPVNKKARREMSRRAWLEEQYASGRLKRPEELIDAHRKREGVKVKSGFKLLEKKADGTGLTMIRGSYEVVERDGETIIQKPKNLNTAILIDVQKKEIINRLEIGVPLAVALRDLKITRYSFKKTCIDDPDFADRVKVCEDAAIGDCEEVLYNKAVSGGDKSEIAALQYANLMNNKRSQSVASRLRMEELKVKRAALGIIESGSKSKSVEPDFESLTPDEFARFTSIYDKINAGSVLDDSEKRDYMDLAMKARLAAMAKRSEVAGKIINGDFDE